MRKPMLLEDIADLRHKEGIEDAELWQEIARLKVGDFVKVTMLIDVRSVETVLVRITSIQGVAYRGKLANKPIAKGLANMKVGSAFVFTASNIHSVAKERPPPGS